METFPTLLGIFFAEFHPVQGPKVTFQAPEGLLKNDTFESISDYVIPKPQLCGRLVTLHVDDLKVIGYPVIIENQRYPRNAMIFNLGMIFEANADSRCFEPVVRKLAKTLRTVELESDFLWNVTTKAQLEGVLEQLLSDLNAFRECQIPFTRENAVNVKLFPIFEEPPTVYDESVPVPLIDLQQFLCRDWDMTMGRVIPLIDGSNYTKRIADQADVDLELARKAIQHLVYYGCVRLVDVFQYTNTYACTSRISKLANDAHLQEQCYKFVVNRDAVDVQFTSIFTLYCALRHGRTVTEVLATRKALAAQIDVRKFILFGVFHDFLRIVNRHLVKAPGSPEVEAIAAPLRRFLAGGAARTMNQVCTALSYAASEIEDVIEADPNIRVLYK